MNQQKRQYQNKKNMNESIECREERLLNQRQYQNKKLAHESADHRQERLEVQSTFVLVVTSCGINTVLSLLRNLDFPTLLQENIY